MTIITITYPAKCKDCIHLKPCTFGKLRRNICTNPLSPRYNPDKQLSMVRLRDRVCDDWELFNGHKNKRNDK